MVRPDCVPPSPIEYNHSPAPRVRHSYIPDYQVSEKCPNDRRGRNLSWDDRDPYQRIVAALKETTQVMGEIDQMIPSWPVE